MTARAEDEVLGAGVEARGLTVAIFASRAEMRRRIARALANEGLEILAETAQPEELEARRMHDAPQIVVLACDPASAGAKRSVRDLKRRFPIARTVLVIPAKGTSPAVRAALEAQVEGVVYSSRVNEALAPTVRAVRAEQIVLPRREKHRVDPPALSHRERQVLRLAVTGHTNDEIATTLFLSTSTVKSHLSSAFGKLAVRSRNEAAALLLNPREPVSRVVFGPRPLSNGEPTPRERGGS